MKPFQQTYTTIEQSKRLLELGLPKATADMYYSAIGIIDEYFDIPTVCATGTFSGYIDLPCWSVGRLIDIFRIITGCEALAVRHKELNDMELIIYKLEGKCGHIIDFSKLED